MQKKMFILTGNNKFYQIKLSISERKKKCFFARVIYSGDRDL